MGISLRKEIMKKDEEVDLLVVDPSLHKVFIGLGWEAPETKDGHAVDIDASAFILNREGKVRRDTDFIFYNNLETDSGAIQHMGDNTTGEKKEGDADDAEVIKVSLDTLAYDIEKVAFAVTIHNADDRQQNFGDIKNAYMRVVNSETGSELARFDLTEDAGSDNAMIFGELFREGLGWKFKAIGTGSKGGLFEIARNYGVNVAPP
ncbi:MAG: TerD family protein [Alphaproteobacteria bacterium]|jgi:tellurium resistance protein TerD|nr:TerD family protein [Alphaproteobacteria bacterium]